MILIVGPFRTMPAETTSLEREWEEYRRRRRSFWKTFLSIVFLMICLGMVSLVEGPNPANKFVGAFALPLFVSIAVCFGLYLRALFRLRTWPCPVCGKHFSISWWSSWPTDTCKHCGAEVGSARPGAPPL